MIKKVSNEGSGVSFAVGRGILVAQEAISMKISGLARWNITSW